MKNYYNILGIGRDDGNYSDISFESIQRAYYRMAFDEKMYDNKDLIEAYRVLNNPDSRKKYDEELKNYLNQSMLTSSSLSQNSLTSEGRLEGEPNKDSLDLNSVDQSVDELAELERKLKSLVERGFEEDLNENNEEKPNDLKSIYELETDSIIGNDEPIENQAEEELNEDIDEFEEELEETINEDEEELNEDIDEAEENKESSNEELNVVKKRANELIKSAEELCNSDKFNNQKLEELKNKIRKFKEILEADDLGKINDFSDDFERYLEKIKKSSVPINSTVVNEYVGKDHQSTKNVSRRTLTTMSGAAGFIVLGTLTVGAPIPMIAGALFAGLTANRLSNRFKLFNDGKVKTFTSLKTNESMLVKKYNSELEIQLSEILSDPYRNYDAEIALAKYKNKVEFLKEKIDLMSSEKIHFGQGLKKRLVIKSLEKQKERAEKNIVFFEGKLSEKKQPDRLSKANESLIKVEQQLKSEGDSKKKISLNMKKSKLLNKRDRLISSKLRYSGIKSGIIQMLDLVIKTSPEDEKGKSKR